MGGATGNHAKVRLLIACIVLVFILGGLGYCTKSEAQESKREIQGTTVSVGLPTIGSDTCEYTSFTISQELVDRKWLASLHTHGDGQCRDEYVSAQVGGSIIRTTHLGDFAIGFGLALWEHGDIAIGPIEIWDNPEPRTANRIQLSAAILIRYHAFGERLIIDLPFHFSTGKSTFFNPGRNFIQVGYRF